MCHLNKFHFALILKVLLLPPGGFMGRWQCFMLRKKKIKFSVSFQPLDCHYNVHHTPYWIFFFFLCDMIQKKTSNNTLGIHIRWFIDVTWLFFVFLYFLILFIELWVGFVCVCVCILLDFDSFEDLFHDSDGLNGWIVEPFVGNLFASPYIIWDACVYVHYVCVHLYK